MLIYLNSSQKLAITPVNSVASSTNTTLHTKNMWRCMHLLVSILLEIYFITDCDLQWLVINDEGCRRGYHSCGSFHWTLWDCSWQATDHVLTRPLQS